MAVSTVMLWTEDELIICGCIFGPESLPLEQRCIREKCRDRLCRKLAGRHGAVPGSALLRLSVAHPLSQSFLSCPCRWSFLGYPVPATLSESEVSCVFPLASSVTLQTKVLLTTGQMLAG